MDIQRTVRVKLECSPNVFLPTIKSYTKAYNYVCKVGWKDDKNTDGVKLHHKTYKKVRKYLTADLTISARTKAVESIKSVKKLQKKENKRALRKKREPKIYKCPQSRQMSIRYNDKTFNIWFDKNIISLQTVKGRIKLPVDIHEYYNEYITWRRRSAELIIRDNTVYLNIVFEKSILDPIPTGKCVGVDRGVKKIAVTSDKRFFGGGNIRRVSERYQRLRSQLKEKKHSGKRHLRKISKKENRFRRDTNHVISKQIVSSLKTGDTIVFEDLTNINRTVKKGWTGKAKSFNRNRMRWSFKQFESFVIYKALFKGIGVAFVKAKDTSRRCSRCGHIAEGNRTCQCFFSCLSCGYQCNADLNASFNISQKHLDSKSSPGGGVINHPNDGFAINVPDLSVVANSAPCGRSN